MLDFAASKAGYDAWLQGQLGADFVAVDLAAKNEAIADSAFVFLRGTYWRWAEIVPDVLPELMDAPQVLAVGDIHLENFGSWRDADGRLIWGVNDFDEAADMPYCLDLVRLAASALLGGDDRKYAALTISSAILDGYQKGLVAPSPIVLERDWDWLRESVVVPEERRARFWKKMDALTNEAAPDRFRTALAAAMPEAGLQFKTSRRVAGTGSLGRPRWVGVADWRGGAVVREAKALVTSGWSLARKQPDAPIRSGEIAAGRFRAPDPWYHVDNGIVVRRLSPNNRKIEADKRGAFLLDPPVHSVMGQELAAVHLGTGDAAASAKAILAHIAKQPAGWLAAAADKAAAATRADRKVFKKGGAPAAPSP